MESFPMCWLRTGRGKKKIQNFQHKFEEESPNLRHAQRRRTKKASFKTTGKKQTCQRGSLRVSVMRRILLCFDKQQIARTFFVITGDSWRMQQKIFRTIFWDYFFVNSLAYKTDLRTIYHAIFLLPKFLGHRWAWLRNILCSFLQAQPPQEFRVERGGRLRSPLTRIWVVCK